jgi:hypothetical protein
MDISRRSAVASRLGVACAEDRLDVENVRAHTATGACANVSGRASLVAVNGVFLCADNTGASALIANRSAIGTWQSLDLI